MTIEERAEKWGKGYPKLPSSELPYDDNDIEYVARNSFQRGAVVQQEILIKNACHTFCRFCPHQCEGHPHDDCQVLIEYQQAIIEAMKGE